MERQIKECQNCKKEFIVEPEDFVFYEKIKVPPPTWCSNCRMVRRMVFANERHLFKRKEDAYGKEVFSGYHPQVLARVYERDYWLGDKWDPMEYGRDYDFSRSFLKQFRELMYVVPWPSRDVTELVNSDYCNFTGWAKNCYLCFDAGFLENCAYVVSGDKIKECFDVTEAEDSELCFESLFIEKCYRTFFSTHCEECRDVWFSRDCVGCSYCLGCVNLRNKQYHIFNKPYTQETYFQELEKLGPGSYKSLQDIAKKADNFWILQPHKFMHGWRNVGVSGDQISHSKNAKLCFNAFELEDSKNCQNNFMKSRDLYDVTAMGGCELVYESVQVGLEVAGLKFAWLCWPSINNVEYSMFCNSSSNLFGCVGLRKKSHCIFNKQYSPEDYLTLREKIIKHMNEMPYTDSGGLVYKYGEFFPPEFSPFAYNETLAYDYFPLDQKSAKERGYLWREPGIKDFKVTVETLSLPDKIKDVSDTIVQEIIRCADCGGVFRIIPMELEFYKKMSLPLPRRCIECRYQARLKYRNQPWFYNRQCQCSGIKDDQGIYKNQTTHFHGTNHCPNEFETSYAPERPEIVYCEACYNNEVI
ncbi:MAG: hypothetical protein HYW89_00465 [Candidatus Sungiibacteriota bacterium]|uniref:Uncharacterized protein n=1 Tax=Candidatus Sungiibacteriota bacterium TaxID=2750080 RepID=A0A7T5RJP0_9BACT|nr:MAG: hypothetical protein HYW89_00465 [Candidatus Sungbacteria bacterium]